MKPAVGITLILNTACYLAVRHQLMVLQLRWAKEKQMANGKWKISAKKITVGVTINVASGTLCTNSQKDERQGQSLQT